MKSTLWNDAKVEKPKTIDPVIGLTSGGYVVVVQWNRKDGYWFELATGESYGDVIFWADFKLPHTFNISDDYYDEM